MQYLLMVLLLLTALFLIVLVLIQRGKGGGLAGAFGGMGGQSAFGTKAGDLFTRITIGVAAFWIILCMVTIKLMASGRELLDSDIGGAAPPVPATASPAPGGGSGATPSAPASPASAPASGGAPASQP